MASRLGQEVIRKVVDILKEEALIMGPDHMLLLGRGASFIHTPVGCIKQVQHADFDIEDLYVTRQRAKPCSIWVALQDMYVISFHLFTHRHEILNYSYTPSRYAQPSNDNWFRDIVNSNLTAHVGMTVKYLRQGFEGECSPRAPLCVRLSLA
jgi:hypothetical protein